MNNHSCIKCGTQYSDDDVDAYYCESCKAEKAKIAAQVDATLANRPRRETKSAIQEYDEQAVDVRGMKFIKIKLS